MIKNFYIDDDDHSEYLSGHETIAEAMAEIRRLAAIPWTEEPNRPPCGNDVCGRTYEIVQFVDSSMGNWELRRKRIVRIRKNDVKWFIRSWCPGDADLWS